MPTILRRWRDYILEMFSGDPSGVPDWVEDMADGNDAGYFGAGSAVWEVHGGLPVLIAGMRALLMQTLHPGAMAGVHDWSRYKEDPLGRLSGTVRWVLTTSFGTREQAEQASAFVGRLHAKVAGTYLNANGEAVAYSAADPELLSWVHVVFAESFLSCHQQWAGPIPGGANEYVSEWAAAGDLMGVANPPRSERELRDQLAAFGPSLVGDERVAEAVRFIRHPPLRRSIMPGYRIIFAGAVASLEPKYRRMLGVKRVWWPAITLTGILLRILGKLLGRPSSSEIYATRRLANIASRGTGEARVDG
ncbi:MAG: hypothetical protein JWR36_699 [Glaciihabitans sp.]|nr:hypothetical protein [Glaciihabitans sp.]